jgi:hypothetical protein
MIAAAWLVPLVPLALAAAPAPCDAPEAERAALLATAGVPEKMDEEERAGLLASRQEALCAALAAPPAPAPAGQRPVNRARLKEILARPEFAHARAQDTDALGRFIARLQAWLDALFESTGAQRFAQGTRVVVLALAVAVVGGVVLRVLAVRHRRRGERGPAGPARGAEALELQAPGEHLRRAREALSAEPREALRQGLLALLSSLERQRLARPDRVRTNREVAADLPRRGAPPELTAAVSALVGFYDRTFYSLQPPAPAEAARFVEEVAALERRWSQRVAG